MRRLTAGFGLALLCITLGAASAAAQFPTVDFYADGANWRTTVYASAPVTHGVNWQLTSCSGFGFSGGAILIPPGGAAAVKNIGGLQCEQAAFGVVPAPVGAQSTSFLQFNDGHSRSAFYVPPLPPFVGPGVRFRSRAIVNRGELVTFVAAYNAGAKPASLVVRVFDEAGRQTATEGILAIAPKGLAFQQLATPIDVGSIAIEIGCVNFGVAGACDADAGPIYGFRSTGPLTGATVEVEPIADNR